MRKVFMILILLGLGHLLFSQDVTNAGLKDKSRHLVSSEYDRNSLTIINLGFQGNYSSQLSSIIGAVKIPEKYFDNTVSNPVIVPAEARESGVIMGHPYKLLNAPFVTNALTKAKVGQMVVSKWFNRDQNGNFSVELLKERGIYNATDNDVMVADASKRGTAALMDMGMGLIDKSYVLVFDFPEIMTMEEIYNRDTVPANKRIMNGFTGKMNAYLYKLNFDEEQATIFYQNLWVSGNSTDTQKRRDLFEQHNFPLNFIRAYSEDLTATQFNPGQVLAPKVQKTQPEMMKMLVETGLQQCLTKIENTNESFRVKAMIYKTNPIAVKIGKKEDLKYDQRFYAYENRQNRKGETYSVRQGVVKSMSVANNLQVATGESEPSLFYQVAGKKLDNLGMFIEQKNALGMNLFLGYTEQGMSGLTGRFELYISPVLYAAFVREGLSKGLRSIKLYAEAGYNNESYLEMNSVDLFEYDFLKYSFGLSKEFFLTRNIHLDPFVGYGFEDATPSGDESEEKYSSQYLEYGSRLGINVSPGFQLIGGVNMFSVLTSEKTAGAESEPESFIYGDQFIDRKGPGISFGIRLTF